MEEDPPKYVTPEIDKRQHRRSTLVTQVRCEALGREDLLVTRDVSVGGLFLLGKQNYPAQAEVSLSFRLSPTDPPLSCRGQIVYAVRGVGLAVQFTDLSEDAKQALQKFVDEAS